MLQTLGRTENLHPGKIELKTGSFDDELPIRCACFILLEYTDMVKVCVNVRP